MRKLSWVMAGAVAAIPGGTLATDLGQARVESYLAQPLRAVIPLTNIDSAEFDELSVGLADEDRFDAVGLDWHSVAGNLEFELVPGAGGAAVEVTSRQEMREPIVSFLVELKSPDGVIIREYNLLLDPPDRAPAPVKTAAVPDRPALPPIEMGASYGPVPRGATLYSLAQAARTGTDLSQQQMMQALVASNPQAFVDGNPDRLLAGVMLKVPGPESVAALHQRLDEGERAEDVEVAAEPDTEVVASGPRVQVIEPVGESPAAAEGAEAEQADERVAEEEAQDSAADQLEGGTVEEETVEEAVAETQAVDMPILPAIDLPMESLGGAGATDEALLMARAENDRLAEQLDAVRAQVARVEELLTMRDEQVDRLEEMLSEEESRTETLRQQLQAIQQDLLYFWGPYLLGAAGLLILLLLLLLWRSARRARQVESSERREPAVDAAPVAAAPVATAAATDEADAERPPQPVEKPAEPEVADIGPPTMDLDEDASGDEVQECIHEAEVLMAYGLTDQAGQLMSDMLASHPDRNDLRLRLVKLWGEAGEVDRFVAEAEQLHERVEETSDEWQEVAELGRSVAPGHRLFGGSETSEEPQSEDDLPVTDEQISPAEVDFGDIDVPTSSQPAADLPEPAEQSVEKPGSEVSRGETRSADEALEPLEFDLSFPERDSAADTSDQSEQKQPEPAAEPSHEKQDALSELEPSSATEVADREPDAPGTIEFDMDDFKPTAPEPAASTDPGKSADDERSDSDLSLDLPESSTTDSVQAPQPPIEIDQAPIVETEPDNAAPASGGDEGDGDATKIGLAEAFLEMGDQESARMMLEEVVEAGGGGAARARELLESMGGK
ncbi:MAG: FimV/HubP family polar landmark protein [Halothiobacillaceae bacterium]